MTEQALLEAVLAEPDSDVPRLVYADWLDEHGDPARAELIRLQCDLAKLEAAGDLWGEERAEKRHRARCLLARSGRRWLPSLEGTEGISWAGFERGFLCAVRARSAAALEQAAPLLRSLAPVTDVILSEDEYIESGRPVRLPWLRSVSISGYGDFDEPRFETLLASELPALRRLLLPGSGLENLGAGHIAKATHLDKLEVLDLSNGFVGLEGVTTLAGAKHLSSVRQLMLASYGGGYVEDPFVTDEALGRLVGKDSVFSGLERIDIGGNNVSGASLRALLGSRLTSLVDVCFRYGSINKAAFDVPATEARWKRLCIGGTSLDPKTLQQMARAAQLAELRCLDLAGCGIDTEGAAKIAKGRWRSSLQTLDLSSNRLDGKAVAALFQEEWPALVKLSLDRNPLDASAAMTLAGAGLPSLRQLDLATVPITSDGVRAIARAPFAEHLRRLDLGSTGCDAAAMSAVAQMPSLTDLSLASNKLDADAMRALKQSRSTGLTDLKLSGTGIEDEGLGVLLSAPFAASLLSLDASSCSLGEAASGAIAEAGELGLCKLVLSYNSLGAGFSKLASASLPSLSSLEITYCGVDGASMEALLDSPLGEQLGYLNAYGNHDVAEIEDRIEALNAHGESPIWVSEDDPERTFYY